MSIYLQIIAATLILGAIMPQKGRERIYYIAVMTAIMLFICVFRYNHLTGDLMKYHAMFLDSDSYGWFSEEIIQEGRNSGFQLFTKLICELSNADFQVYLAVLSIISYLILAYIIYRYSPAPWMSFLVWSCMGMFIFSLTSIKQAFAMAFVMLAFIGIAENRLSIYLFSMLIAGFIHAPALIFLPAYWLTKMRVNRNTIFFYLLLGFLMYTFKDQFVALVSSFYYEDDEVMIYSGDLGGRFIMLLGFTLFGVLLKGFPNRDHEKLFHIMAIATILQMLSGYDNVFTRLTDYYFQFSVLYIPMVFFPSDSNPQRSPIQAVFPFNERSLKALAILIALFMMWFYYTYSINITIAYEVDNYLNFRFMWDVP
ncbi:MAG: EpsG family protein [Oscillospiraceae bacterium]|nr:EpsG family protein [Oscillospiraceae bacterium]